MQQGVEEIAGYPARVESFDLARPCYPSPAWFEAPCPAAPNPLDLAAAASWSSEADAPPGAVSSQSISLYSVGHVEEMIDAAALLREASIKDPPYWALVWIGAKAVAAELAYGPALTGMRVLDLGCGLGLSGLSAAIRGASVSFADYLEAPLDFVEASVRLNALSNCRCRRVDFTVDRLEERFDLILAADVVYDPAHYQALAGFLDLHLHTGGTILLTESLRADAKDFLAMMQARAFTDENSATWIEEDGKLERTWLHHLTRLPPATERSFPTK